MFEKYVLGTESFYNQSIKDLNPFKLFIKFILRIFLIVILVVKIIIEFWFLKRSLFRTIYLLYYFIKLWPIDLFESYGDETPQEKAEREEKKKKELELQKAYVQRIKLYESTQLGNKLYFFLKNLSLFNLIFYFNSIKYSAFADVNLFRVTYRMFDAKVGFISVFLDSHTTYSNFFNTLKRGFLFGVRSFWKGVRFWFIALIIALCVFYYSMVIRCVPFNKIMFVWIVVAMFAYWLLSGFVFFIKKYQFGKFTSAIQRFWRRSYILFWLIEFSLFSVFFYLTLNANNESWYMYDQLQVFKTGLFSWRSFLIKIFPLTLLLVLGYLFLLTIKWNVFNKHSLWLFVLTVLLVYIVWVEFYQFFHVINFYGNFNWIFDIDEKVWSLELEVRKSRTVNHYIMLMVMLKFWHIIFIFIIWVFFVLRCLEIGRIRYPLLSANLQNFLILYLFAWVMMFPWLKFLLRRYLDMPYYWFYVNNRRLGYRVFFNDICVYYYALSNFFYYHLIRFDNFIKFNFFYWSFEDDYFATKKSFIKNVILNSLQ